MDKGITAICPAQAIALALQQVQAVDFFGVITAACSRALRQAEAYSSGVQVMLTMVSIDGELNEELSRSLSLAKEILQVKLACEMVEVGEICGSGPFLVWLSSQEVFELFT
jgi:hypothetical protein